MCSVVVLVPSWWSEAVLNLGSYIMKANISQCPRQRLKESGTLCRGPTHGMHRSLLFLELTELDLLPQPLLAVWVARRTAEQNKISPMYPVIYWTSYLLGVRIHTWKPASKPRMWMVPSHHHLRSTITINAVLPGQWLATPIWGEIENVNFCLPSRCV